MPGKRKPPETNPSPSPESEIATKQGDTKVDTSIDERDELDPGVRKLDAEKEELKAEKKKLETKLDALEAEKKELETKLDALEAERVLLVQFGTGQATATDLNTKFPTYPRWTNPAGDDERIRERLKKLADEKKTLADEKKIKEEQLTEVLKQLTNISKSDRPQVYQTAATTPVSYKPRFSAEVAHFWKGAKEEIDANAYPSLRNIPFIHFVGESGAGKTWAATYDALQALRDLRIGEKNGFKIILRQHVLSVQLNDRFQKMNTKEERNEEAKKWLYNSLKDLSECVVLLVIDECHACIPLCRGVCAEWAAITAHAQQKNIFLFTTFSGVQTIKLNAEADLTSTAQDDAPEDALATDGNRVKVITTTGWPADEKNPHLTAYAVLNKHRVSNELPKCDSDNPNEFVDRMIRLANLNTAALQAIATVLPKDLSPTSFTMELANQACDKVADMLTKRNGMKQKPCLRHMKTVSNLLFAAALANVSPDRARDLSVHGFLTFRETHEGTFDVVLNGFYAQVLFRAAGITFNVYFGLDWKVFEKLAMTWLQLRVRAFVHFLEKTQVALSELLPGCKSQDVVTLDRDQCDRMLVALQTRVSSVESIRNGMTPVGESNALPVSDFSWVINGSTAPFADGMALLRASGKRELEEGPARGLCVFLQAKCSESRTRGVEGDNWPLTIAQVKKEMTKCGFAVDNESSDTYKKQAEVHQHLVKECKAKEAVFILFTNKSVAECDNYGDHVVLITQANSEKRTGVFSLIAQGLNEVQKAET